MITKKKIILFDLDGVLIDSKKNMLKAWKKVQKKHGIEIKFKKYFENIGLPFQDILKKNKNKKKYKRNRKNI